MTVRAKFKVDSVEQSVSSTGEVYGENVKLSPVYSENKNTENYAFWEATPSGMFQMYFTNRNIFR